MSENGVTPPLTMDSMEALKMYGEHFDTNHEDTFAFNCISFPWSGKQGSCKDDDTQDSLQVCTELEKDMILSKTKQSPKQLHLGLDGESADREVDSDGEEVQLCSHCRLPTGHSYYTGVLQHPKGVSYGQGDRTDVHHHQECVAQAAVASLREEDEKRLKSDREKKTKRHEEYGIGWGVEHIPRNDQAAKKLVMRDIPQGLVCAVLDEEMQRIHLASTVEPAAALNLEYLSTSLAVRRSEGHEPVFSLDPVGTVHDRHTMQTKRFDPEWLAGTSVGDVLFQADYHLKELSMGEYAQPVVGMKSCLEYSDLEKNQSEWSARQWFMVRKAEIHITDRNILVPFVKMGVESREQVMNSSSHEDKQITRANHPMVMFAETFTKNFDIIAERKSVVYHLRELAKAAVIAKYLLDTQVHVEEAWFSLAREREMACSLEVPQLWNERIFSKVGVTVANGVLSQGAVSSLHGAYGGVQFGLDKFNLNRVSRRGCLGESMLHATVSAVAKTIQHLPSGRISRATLNSGRLPSGIAPCHMTTARGAAAIGISLPMRHQVPKLGVNRLHSQLSTWEAPSAVAPFLGLSLAPEGAIGPKGAIGPAKGAIGPAPKFNLASPAMPGQRSAGKLNLHPMNPMAPRLGISTAHPGASMSSSVGGPQRLPPSAMRGTVDIPQRPRMVLSDPVIPGQFHQQPQGSDRLQGVDLRLDRFDLVDAKRVASEAQEGSWSSDLRSLDECASIGKSFWTSLEDDSRIFKKEDRSLLKEIFNPKLTDRRSEGDVFCPPDASHTYVTRLRALLKQEDMVRQQRKTHFLSQDFSIDNPTSLFPSSWKSTFESDHTEQQPGHPLQRLDYQEQAAEALQRALEDSVPIFNESTEEGLRFRIYSLGDLQVRTIQEIDGAEIVGAVFSKKLLMGSGSVDEGVQIHDDERLIRATQYVELSRSTGRNYFVVVETENGRKIRLERLATGEVAWDQEPIDLEVRNSTAKVINNGDCTPGLVVGEMKSYQHLLARGSVMSISFHTSGASASTCKRYAQNIFARATGTVSPAPCRAASFQAPVLMNSFITPYLGRKKSRGNK